ncbi:MAG TPA: DASS family sodium-coupled anion symporter [Vitreimonas sp.]|uniref:SLC13 family permease n=1 Tax=Vitreimonas sp. TaxID=3069702 RepID=UPI002D54C284|nr:DASS family sodium-coupled anion symporter [Vitreimonas sp.]HYD87530.1 DASS family sodium-coupled anion symporter [Vitreimonas sp.]
MTDGAATAGEETGFGPLGRLVGLILGPALALGLQILPPPDGLSVEAWRVVSLAALMVTFWVTEAIPISATALLPLAVLPLIGAASIGEAAAPYADPIVFLFIGGFILAACVERWRLHERIALSIASVAGGRPVALVGGFMIAAALISMWISNTATTLMLAPIAIGAARALSVDGKPDLALGGALTLGVAHAATIAGVGTPVGSPTNLIAIAFFERAGEPMAFIEWMTRAIPIMLLMLPLAWLLLCWPLFGRKAHARFDAIGAVVREALAKLGSMSQPEVRIGAVFALVALAWMMRTELVKLPGLSALTDTGIAVIGALSLFFIPSGRPGREKLIDWKTAERIPWGIAVLFGGGLSLAAAMESTGLAAWIGGFIADLDGVSALGLVAVLVVATILVSELASNVATLTSMLPVVAAVASATDTPLQQLAFPVAIAASFAFMLPVATAPNAIAYSSGLLTLKRMLSVGFGLNVAAIVLIIAFAAA